MSIDFGRVGKPLGSESGIRDILSQYFAALCICKVLNRTTGIASIPALLERIFTIKHQLNMRIVCLQVNSTKIIFW